MTIGSRIKAARLQNGLSQMDLAELVKVSQPTVANWENGSHMPRQSVLGRVAESLNISSNWIVEGHESDLTAQRGMAPYLTLPIRHVPILKWPDSADNFNPAAAAEDYLAASLQTDRAIAFVASDPAMSAEFSIGSIIILDLNATELNDGGCYLLNVDGDLTLRRWRESPQRLEPASNIPGYEPLFVKKRPKPLAKAIASIRRH